MSDSDSQSSSDEVCSDDDVVTVSKSTKIHFVNNRVKKYEKGEKGVPKDRIRAALQYNKLNDGGDDLWDSNKFKNVSIGFDKESEAVLFQQEKGKGIIIKEAGEPKACGYCSAFTICEQRQRYFNEDGSSR